MIAFVGCKVVSGMACVGAPYIYNEQLCMQDSTMTANDDKPLGNLHRTSYHSSETV